MNIKIKKKKETTSQFVSTSLEQKLHRDREEFEQQKFIEKNEVEFCLDVEGTSENVDFENVEANWLNLSAFVEREKLFSGQEKVTFAFTLFEQNLLRDREEFE